MFRLGFSFLLFLLVEFNLYSQKILDFDKLSMEDGFSASKANAIIQDRKGFIWVGTWNGLNRYDGYQCEIFRPSYQDSTTISNREVVALMEDHLGNIWIGTSSGLNCLNPATREIKRYDFQNRIMSLLEDRENKIWVGTWNGGLYKIDPESGEKAHYLASDNVSDIFEDSQNNLWIATFNGLVNFDRKTSRYDRYLPVSKQGVNSISNSTVTQIVEAKNGNLWVGTWGGGINKVIVHPNRDSLRFVHYKSSARNGSLHSNVIYRMHYDEFGNLWAGTWNDGLILLEPEQQDKSPELAIFYSYKNDISDPYSLSGNNITALFVDRSGVLWVGSSKIDRANILKTGLSQYKTKEFSEGVYFQNAVRSFAGQEDNLWVGTSKDLKLYKYNNEQYKFVKDINNLSYRFENTDYVSNSILSVLSNNNGLWVGTDDAGLIFFPGSTALSKEKPELFYFNTETNPGLPGNKVAILFQSQKFPGVIWGGTMQNGFVKMSYKNGKASITQFKAGNTNGALTDNNIRAIVEDRDGLVWIGTQNGLNCFNPATQTFKKYYHSFSDTTSINDNVINVLFEDSVGNLWIGSNSGLNKKIVRELPDGRKEVCFKAYPHVKDINDEIITNILEDESNNLWISLYRGVVQFAPANEAIVKEYFTKEYQNLAIERNASIKTNNGMFLFGGGNGFISFYPDSLFKNSLPPKVCITDFLIFNDRIDDLSSNTKIDSVFFIMPYRESIELSYKDEALTFIFSAMDYKDPKRNKYAYILEGFDKKWNEVGTRNSATYTSIPPGEYVFKVKAANSDGIWSTEPQNYEFRFLLLVENELCLYILLYSYVGTFIFFQRVFHYPGARKKPDSA